MDMPTDQVQQNTPSPCPGQVLNDIYVALKEKGYNPVMQIVGYLLTEDPTYITNHNHARALICQLDRDDLLSEIVRYYFEQQHTPCDESKESAT
jgi:uncharacterized protein (UPF0297 family)